MIWKTQWKYNLGNTLEVDLDYTLSQTALGGFGKCTRSGFGKYTVSNCPREIWLKPYKFSKLYRLPVEFGIN
jgi:hypothetical protein